jgi:gluconate kinase
MANKDNSQVLVTVVWCSGNKGNWKDVIQRRNNGSGLVHLGNGK